MFIILPKAILVRKKMIILINLKKKDQKNLKYFRCLNHQTVSNWICAYFCFIVFVYFKTIDWQSKMF